MKRLRRLCRTYIRQIKVAITTRELVSEGAHAAVLADIADLGKVETQYGGKLLNAKAFAMLNHPSS